VVHEASRFHRLEENLGAATLDLPTEQLADLDAAAAAVEITGERYSPQMQQMIDR
jgi:aryl-alcohol dehydrogenase-like predicted oxidoreductase